MSEPILYTKKLTKYFGKLAANSEIDISVKRGEIHAIAGENGAGKSTLMKMLFGIYTPSSGEIVVDGRKMSRWNPTLAREMGIGMVFQDFRIVPAFTVLENIFLTLKHWGKVINRKRLREEILQKAREYHLDVDPDIEVWKLDLGQRQHVEILKILLDPQTRIMIFDEPTSVLAPHEIVSFLKMLRDFREKGFGIFLITHKINEILAVADRITILRHGKKVDEFNRTEGFDEQAIVSAMLGESEANFNVDRPEDNECDREKSMKISLRDVSVKDDHGRLILKNVNIDLVPGEILGIAGISGNGQKELAEALYGTRKIQNGTLIADETDITQSAIKKRILMGMRMVTEDPIHDSVIPGFSILENMTLTGLSVQTKRGDVDWKFMEEELSSHKEINNLNVPECHRIARTLSGGNLQRMAFARAIISSPRFLIACYPSRGLDVATVKSVHQTLFRLKLNGTTVLLISEDLAELFSVADRLVVLSGHTSYGPYPVEETTPNEIGKIMLQGETVNE